MNAIQRLFFISMAFVVTLGAFLGAFLFASLLPYFSTIGRVSAGVVIVGLLCVSCLMVAFTFSKASSWILNRKVIKHGEIMVYLADNGAITHLSAMHEAAKVAQLPAPKEEEQEPLPSDDATVLEFYKKGMSLRNIVDATGRTYYQVQKITAGK